MIKNINVYIIFYEKTIGKHMILIGCDLKSLFPNNGESVCVCMWETLNQRV